MKSIDGFAIGKVTEVKDPEGLGRIKVRYPHLSDTITEWASVASIMAGTGRGCYFMPEVDDEVLVAPQQGDWNHPFIIGFVWNPVQAPPSQDPRERMICSKNKHIIRFLDPEPTDGDQGGIVIQDAHDNMITFAAWGIRIVTAGTLIIEAGALNIMGRNVRSIGSEL